MPRLNYAAPGVYVEEVPSAQQPIAGVGTNTVGFIGLVPEPTIKFPVRNEEYDTRLAVEAMMPPEAKKEEVDKKNEELKQKQRDKDTFQQKLNGLEEQLRKLESAEEPPESKEVKKGDFNKRIARARTDVDKAEAAIRGIQSDLEVLQEKDVADDPRLRPYTLESFDVTVAPFDTKLCTNFTEYTNRFGPFSADDPAKAPGTALHPGHRALTHAVYGFFKNGGTRCFVARVTDWGEIGEALEAFESIDALAIIAAPGFYTKDEARPIWESLVGHCEACEDRFTILDCSSDAVTESGDPDMGHLNYDDPDPAKHLLPPRNKNAAFYLPYIEVLDPAKQLQDSDPARRVEARYHGRLYVPPSGHIAGIYARTDEERGVKAPANTVVLGALNVACYISQAKQELLNPLGANCIRNMNGDITVWGARTIGGDSNLEWKYISVRRFFLFLKESIDEGTQWAVFEPNDSALWGKIRRNVSAFLTNVWRSGALFGLTQQEAFYVKCDEETNPPEVRDLGQVIIEIGVAIVRPAEFVIFRVTQSVGQPGG